MNNSTALPATDVRPESALSKQPALAAKMANELFMFSVIDLLGSNLSSVLLLRGSETDEADSVSTLSIESSFWSSKMPIGAVFASELESPSTVLSVGDDLKMVWIAAMPDTAEMIETHSFGNIRMASKFPDHSVNSSAAVLTISCRSNPSLPKPTAVRPIFVHTVPECLAALYHTQTILGKDNLRNLLTDNLHLAVSD